MVLPVGQAVELVAVIIAFLGLVAQGHLVKVMRVELTVLPVLVMEPVAAVEHLRLVQPEQALQVAMAAQEQLRLFQVQA
jgi:hypothetical protein